MNWERLMEGCPECGKSVHETSWVKYHCESCDECLDAEDRHEIGECAMETGEFCDDCRQEIDADHGDQQRLHEKECGE